MKRVIRLDPTIASQTPAAVFPLIAGCLADDPTPAVRQIRRQGLWEYVAAESCDAQVGAVLLDRLNRLGVDVPESAVAQMQAYREHVAAANAYKCAEVSRALTRLRMAKIPFLLLKGAALNAIAYEPGLRPMTDMDVLVRVEDTANADRVLRNAGCRPGADLVSNDFYPRYYYEREYFTRRNPPVKIDLHCRPFRLLRYAQTVPDKAFWGECRQVRLDDVDVQIPGVEDMLIHLAVHACCHGGSHLRWLYDIRLWIARFGHEINIARLADKCHRWKLSLPVHRALVMTRETFESKDETLDAVICATTRKAGPMDRLALATAHLGQESPVLYTMVNVLSTPGIRFRLGYLGSVLLPDSSHLAQLYHRRHVGWQLCAHAVRLSRCVQRAVTGTAASTS